MVVVVDELVSGVWLEGEVLLGVVDCAPDVDGDVLLLGVCELGDVDEPV